MKTAFRWIALVGALVALTSTGPALAAHVVRTPSRITIASDGLRFHGKVHSSKRACRKGRKVRLFRVGSPRGPYTEGHDQVVGRTRTNARGKWQIIIPGAAGITQERFYAKVQLRKKSGGGHVLVCKADRSPAVKPTS